MKKIVILLTLCISMCLVSCGNSSINKSSVSEDKKISKELTKENMKDSEKIIDKTSKVNQIGSYLDELYQENNIVFSPLSLDMALGMAQVGASNNTLKALDEFLDTENYNEYASNYISKMTFDNTGEWYDSVYQICNSAWANKNIEVKNSFKEILQNDFNAEINNVDFSNNETIGIINNWIDTKTRGLIKELIYQLDPSTVMMLVNAVYFEDEWKEQGFLVDNTFTDIDGISTMTDFVRSTDCDYYFENDYAYGFSKDYKSGLTFIGILPKEEGDFNLKDLDLESFLESKTNKYDVSMELPVFSFESDLFLNSLLYNNGLSSLFEGADFSNISDMPMEVSEVVQSCNILVDENGTKASAVTAFILNKASMETDSRENKEVILDRPFAFMIYDEKNDQVVFIGKVVLL